MPKRSYGSAVEQRVKLLLEAMLAYACDEMDEYKYRKLERCRWQKEDNLTPKLEVKVTLEALKELTKGKLSVEAIRESLGYLEDFLEILKRRPHQQGSRYWQFTLLLWSKDKQENLKQFELEWEKRRTKKSKQVNLSLQARSNALVKKANSYLIEMPDVTYFYGRDEELATLQQWIINEKCRFVALLGMGGIGKTALGAFLVQNIQGQFEYVIWRSIRDSPPIENILDDLIKFLSNQQEIDISQAPSDKIRVLISHLQSYRCLIIFDNVESILQAGNQVGQYREGYQEYGDLFRLIGELYHQSCVVITSREKPIELIGLESNTLPIRSLRLIGLKSEAHKLISFEELCGSEEQIQAIIERYSGNPLALKIVATSIKDLFAGNVTEFLSQSTSVFNGIRTLLAQQINRLSDLEKSIIYWLAINRESVSVDELRDDIIQSVTQTKLLESLEYLRWRSLIERDEQGFSLQNVVMEYMTDRLIEEISLDIRNENFENFNKYALIKASAKDYIRETQIRLILQPIIESLVDIDVENKFKVFLQSIRNQSPIKLGYLAGNVLNLLCQMNKQVKNYDFSNLNISQAYLQGKNIHSVNFAYSNVNKSVFTKVFGNVLSVAFSPNGKLLATGDTSGNVCLWNIADTQKVFTGEHTNWVTSVVFSPDGSILVSSSEDGTLKIWNFSTGQCLKTLVGHTGWVLSGAFRSDGKLIISGSVDQTVKIWDIETYQVLKTLQGHTSWVTSVAFGANDIAASGSADKTIKLWNINTGECIKTLHGHTAMVRFIAFNPQGKTLASGGNDNTIRIWDIETGKCSRIFGGNMHGIHVQSVAFNPQGNVIASADKILRLWDVNTGECIKTLQGHTNTVKSVAFNGQGDTIASGSHDQKVKLWDVKTGQCIKTFEGNVNWLRSVCFSPEGNIIASGGVDKAVRIWDIHTGNCIKAFEGHTNTLKSVVFSPDGKMIASGGDDEKIKLWNIATGQCLITLHGHTAIIVSLAFSPQGNILVSGSEDTTVRIWNVHTGECLKILQSHSHWVESVSFSPNGLLATCSSDQTIKIWDIRDLNTEKCLHNLHAHTGIVRSVTFSPDGKMIASSSEDKTIKIWSVTTGKCLQTFSGHTNWVWQVTFSPQGNILASASEDNTVRIWHINTGKCLKILHGHISWVRSVTFSPDGEVIASASEDETIKLWDVKSGKCLKTLRILKPYENMNITGVKGLTEAEKSNLKLLGAFEVET